MIYDRKRNRILKKNGTSIVSVSDYCSFLVEETEWKKGLAIVDEDEAQAVKDIYNINILADLENDDINDNQEINININEKKETIIDRVFHSIRRKEDDSDLERIEYELDFFLSKNEYIDLLFQLIKVVDKMKKSSKIVWNGRGSTCSSYVLFLLEIHSIDALKWNIPFNELTKEE